MTPLYDLDALMIDLLRLRLFFGGVIDSSSVPCVKCAERPVSQQLLCQ